MVGHHSRRWGGAGRGGPSGVACGRGAGRRKRVEGRVLRHLRAVYDRAVHRLHPVPLCEHQRGGAHRPAQIRPHVYLFPHRRVLYPRVPHRPAGALGLVLVRGDLDPGHRGIGDEPDLDRLPPRRHLHHLYRHGLAGGGRPLPSVAGAGDSGRGLAAGRRHTLHHRRRTVRAEMAGAEQSPVRLPRGVPRVHRAGVGGPFCDDVQGAAAAVKAQKLPCPELPSRGVFLQSFKHPEAVRRHALPEIEAQQRGVVPVGGVEHHLGQPLPAGVLLHTRQQELSHSPAPEVRADVQLLQLEISFPGLLDLDIPPGCVHLSPGVAHHLAARLGHPAAVAGKFLPAGGRVAVGDALRRPRLGKGQQGGHILRFRRTDPNGMIPAHISRSMIQTGAEFSPIR